MNRKSDMRPLTVPPSFTSRRIGPGILGLKSFRRVTEPLAISSNMPRPPWSDFANMPGMRCVCSEHPTDHPFQEAFPTSWNAMGELLTKALVRYRGMSVLGRYLHSCPAGPVPVSSKLIVLQMKDMSIPKGNELKLKTRSRQLVYLLSRPSWFGGYV
jgi:hypothetical protein